MIRPAHGVVTTKRINKSFGLPDQWETSQQNGAKKRQKLHAMETHKLSKYIIKKNNTYINIYIYPIIHTII